MRLDRVVVGYDGSPNARKAVGVAIELTTENGTVHLVTSYEEPSAAKMLRITATAPTETGAPLWVTPRENPLPDDDRLRRHDLLAVAINWTWQPHGRVEAGFGEQVRPLVRGDQGMTRP